MYSTNVLLALTIVSVYTAAPEVTCSRKSRAAIPAVSLKYTYRSLLVSNLYINSYAYGTLDYHLVVTLAAVYHIN